LTNGNASFRYAMLGES